MSTRSAIIKKTGANYYGVYCHNDGYLNGVGKTLLENYKTDAEVDALISLGSLSSVGVDLNETFAYHRDRGEEYYKPTRSKSVIAVAKRIDHNGYVYVYENGIWMVWITEKGMEEGLEPGYYPLSEVVVLEKDDTSKQYNCIHCGNPIYPTWHKTGTKLKPDWKHKILEGDAYPMWACNRYMNWAEAPKDAVWTELKIKQTGAE